MDGCYNERRRRCSAQGPILWDMMDWIIFTMHNDAVRMGVGPFYFSFFISSSVQTQPTLSSTHGCQGIFPLRVQNYKLCTQRERVHLYPGAYKKSSDEARIGGDGLHPLISTVKLSRSILLVPALGRVRRASALCASLGFRRFCRDLQNAKKLATARAGFIRQCTHQRGGGKNTPSLHNVTPGEKVELIRCEGARGIGYFRGCAPPVPI